MMDFLYFPEDKSLYITALFNFLPFILGTVLTFWWLKKISKKEQEFMEKSPEQYISKKLFLETSAEKTDNEK